MVKFKKLGFNAPLRCFS